MVLRRVHFRYARLVLPPRLPWIVLGLLATLGIVGSASSCKTATAVRVGYKSDLTCTAGKLPQSVKFSLQRVGKPTSFDLAKTETPRASSDCTTGTPADLGDLLIRPNPSEPSLDYELVTAAATGTTTTDDACGIGPNGVVTGKLEGAECIVSKRRVRFAEGQELSFQVFLSARCAGISCPSETTCDPLTALCVGIPTNGEPPAQDSGVEGSKLENEAGPSDASVSDATVDAGIPGIPDCSVKQTPGAICGSAYSLTAAAPFPIVARANKVAFVTSSKVFSTLTEVSFQQATPAPTLLQPLTPTDGDEIVGVGYDEAANLYAGVRLLTAGQPDRLYKRTSDWTQLGFRPDPKNDTTHTRILALVTSTSGLGGLFGNSATSPTSVVPFLIEDKAGAIEPADNVPFTFTVAPRPELSSSDTAKNRIRFPSAPSGGPMGIGLISFEGAGLATQSGALPRGNSPVTELVGGDGPTFFFLARDVSSMKLFRTLPGTLGPSSGELVDNAEGPTAYDSERIYVVSQGRLLSVARAAPNDICRVASAGGTPTSAVRSVAVDGNCVYTLNETNAAAQSGMKGFELRSSNKAATPK
jgi:hypothetical protein